MGAVNNAPFVDLNGPLNGGFTFLTEFIEDGQPIPVAAHDAFIGDFDSLLLSGMSIFLDGGVDGEDEGLALGPLPFGLMARTTGQSITVTGDAPTATYERVLAELRYFNVRDEPQYTPRQVEVSVNDGLLNSRFSQTIITVFAVNDPPRLLLNAAKDRPNRTITFTEKRPDDVLLTGAVSTMSLTDDDTQLFSRMEVDILGARNAAAGAEAVVILSQEARALVKSRMLTPTLLVLEWKTPATPAEVGQVCLRLVPGPNTG